MHADLTRWTHDPAFAYRSVLLQQGRVLLDSDWNEQAAITAHHDTARTADIVGPSGGPAPLDGGVGPFAIVDLTTGLEPSAAPWARLGVTPGHYYVDGVLAESAPDPAHPAGAGAWPLADQPHRPTIGSGAGASPGLEEPPAADGDGRYAAYLDVFERTVSPDERPELLESALGGPDTAMRQQTAWQVSLTRLVGGEVCSQLDDVAEVTPRTMVARLRDAAPDADPCQITSGGGYQRLENQLYRVEICSVTPSPRFVWSRENGSVTAGLVQIGTTTEAGMDAALTLDRVGRDEELSIRQDDLVEVTSADRQLRRLPGFMARVGPVIDLVIHVHWLAGAPASVASLGRAAVARRWDGGPSTLSTAPIDLEGGITVAFPAGGTPSVGDFWLIPARTARLAYGTSARQGTLDWPWDSPTASPLPPVGPIHHHAPLGILSRTGTSWTLESDCRHLFPPLTELVTIDLVGGDGQEAMPGDELGAPVRVVVRNGGLPVEGAPVRFTPAGGTLREEVSGSPPAGGIVATDADGVAAVRWTLDPAGASTQALTAQRLDDTSTPVDVAVVVSGRLSIASQVQWQPACDAFAGTRTVQDALAQLATTPTLRLLGGDGQEVSSEGVTVPQLVRVAVDSPCGPARVKVVAQGTDGALVLASQEGAPVPPTLTGTGAGASDAVEPDATGVAAFVWQPSFAQGRSDVLTISVDGLGLAPVRVSAQLDVSVAGTLGMHVVETAFLNGSAFENDVVVDVADLVSGIAITIDSLVLPESVNGKPVGRVLMDLPWPTPPELDQWSDQSFALQTVELVGELIARKNLILWRSKLPLDSVLGRVRERLLGFEANNRLGSPALPIRMRFQLDGWAIMDARNPERHLNGHAITQSVQGQTVLRLPTTDDIAGGRFDMWFWFGTDKPGPNFTRFRIEDFSGSTLTKITRLATDAGVPVTVVEEDAPGIRKNTVLGTIPASGTLLLPGQPLTIRVSRGVGG
ncbi:DUF6519 domain-containing protein [Humibacillus xanthopallidus]|uniref:PASTA domain-containing protein n=1 Tax=Humibacillus xanthopallidus TaxID=412689 RepID=A0A543I2X3_9MICO|nr:DUF6519 domain-containing protein [Humibacillus xanthopallidus]TQM64946.1 PASTA domain-containing protein [Humibacillus xanthopallidus]